jgi:hypothetical protein
MKQPRVEDFDPEASPSLKSSLTGMPAIAKPPANGPDSPQPSHPPDNRAPTTVLATEPVIPSDQTQLIGEQVSMSSSTLASYPVSMIESIRKTVKVPGKEVSFSRLTPQEKNRLRDILYTFRRQGMKVSENEINRIAVNFLIQDFQVYGRASVLARVIAALLA